MEALLHLIMVALKSALEVKRAELLK